MGTTASLAGSSNIAGQNEKYLLKQLRDMKSGDRAQNLMVGIVDTLSDQDMVIWLLFMQGKWRLKARLILTLPCRVSIYTGQELLEKE